MDDEIRQLLRQTSREQMYALWGRAKEKDFKGLNDGERRIAQIMLEHQDEFFNQFEFADLTSMHEFDPQTEYDPFLHVTIHSIVQTQLEQKEPIEVLQFYNAVRKKQYSHHDAVHLIGQILICLIFDVLKYQQPFGLDTYRRLLEKYKTRNPEKLMDLLESEPLLAD